MDNEWDMWIEWDHGIIWPTVMLLRHARPAPRGRVSTHLVPVSLDPAAHTRSRR